ncbi:MAG TPA: gluconeogenesis factor YvcK family protein [Terriglobia bacterium]|jgi:uncharacterized cofD-like protein|nr:gluconeogenesis factor YvcK family protein [Terriglobia bacterium]
MRIVGIGGGTGLPVLLKGLTEISNPQTPLDLTAIVTVSDSGGSTGILRRAFNMPAMGDIRNCLISLAAKDSVLTSVCQHRFDNPETFAGHSVGNLILSALYQMSGNFAAAVRQASDLLELKGRVFPATETPVTLCALYENGTIAEGESDIPKSGLHISRVWLDPDDPAPAPGVLEALETADAIVIGPGSLYTSIIPNLLVAGVADALKASRAIKIYICNIMSQVGETDGYSAAEHVQHLLEYLEAPIDVCVLNSSTVGTAVAERYLKSGSEMVAASSEDQDQIRRMGVVPVAAPLLSDREVKARHDPRTLARLVVSLARGFAGVHEIICSQGNGR